MSETNWTSVNDLVPDNGRRVLIATDMGHVQMGFHDERGWASVPGAWPLHDVTHWMPLPLAPTPPAGGAGGEVHNP